jgi:hypothetical protein
MRVRWRDEMPRAMRREQLDMGSHLYVSKHVGVLRKKPTDEAGKWLEKLSKVKSEA